MSGPFNMKDLVSAQQCGTANAMTSFANQQNAMAAQMAETKGFATMQPDLMAMGQGPDMMGSMGPQSMQAQQEAMQFMQAMQGGPANLAFQQGLPQLPQMQPQVARQPSMEQMAMANQFAAMNMRQESLGPQDLGQFYQEGPHSQQSMGQAFAAQDQAQRMGGMQFRPQMMQPQMMQRPMMMNPMMGQMGQMPMMGMPGPMYAPMMPMQQQAPQVMQKQAEVQQVVQEAKQDVTQEVEQPQQVQMGGGLDNDMIQKLKNSDNPKWRNSKFLQFIEKVQDGRITFTDENTLVEKTAEQLSAEQTVEDVKQVDEQTEGNLWAEQFAQMQNMFGTQNQAENPEFDFERAMQAMQAANQPQDPTYMFADMKENKYTNDDSAFETGIQLFNAGRLKEAIQAFEVAVTNDAEHAEAWRYLGQANAENEQEDRAIAALLKAIQVDPYNLEALMMLGVSYTNDLEEARALRYLKTWLMNNPDYQGLDIKSLQDFDELYGGGTDSGQFDNQLHTEVTKMFLSAVKLNPRDADLHIVLGVLYHITSDWDKSIASFQNAIKLRPDDAQLWNKLGATQANSSRSYEAMYAYKRALQLRPTYVRSLANLAIAFANQGLHEDACRTYLATLKQNSDAQHIWSYLRISLSHMGRDDLVALTRERDVNAFNSHFDF